MGEENGQKWQTDISLKILDQLQYLEQLLSKNLVTENVSEEVKVVFKIKMKKESIMSIKNAFNSFRSLEARNPSRIYTTFSICSVT